MCELPTADIVIKSIVSDRPINDSDVQKILLIFEESQCPNESMFHSIERFRKYDGHTIQIGDGVTFKRSIEL